MSMKRRWLKALLMLMIAGSSFVGPMNPKEIEDLLHIMNETRVEFTIPDESHKGREVPFERVESVRRSVRSALLAHTA